MPSIHDILLIRLHPGDLTSRGLWYMMRSQHTLGSIWMRSGREIRDIFLMAWLGVEQLGIFTNSLVVSCATKARRQGRF